MISQCVVVKPSIGIYRPSCDSSSLHAAILAFKWSTISSPGLLGTTLGDRRTGDGVRTGDCGTAAARGGVETSAPGQGAPCSSGASTSGAGGPALRAGDLAAGGVSVPPWLADDNGMAYSPKSMLSTVPCSSCAMSSPPNRSYPRLTGDLPCRVPVPGDAWSRLLRAADTASSSNSACDLVAPGDEPPSCLPNASGGLCGDAACCCEPSSDRALRALGGVRLGTGSASKLASGDGRVPSVLWL